MCACQHFPKLTEGRKSFSPRPLLIWITLFQCTQAVPVIHTWPASACKRFAEVLQAWAQCSPAQFCTEISPHMCHSHLTGRDSKPPTGRLVVQTFLVNLGSVWAELTAQTQRCLYLLYVISEISFLCMPKMKYKRLQWENCAACKALSCTNRRKRIGTQVKKWVMSPSTLSLHVRPSHSSAV